MELSAYAALGNHNTTVKETYLKAACDPCMDEARDVLREVYVDVQCKLLHNTPPPSTYDLREVLLQEHMKLNTDAEWQAKADATYQASLAQAGWQLPCTACPAPPSSPSNGDTRSLSISKELSFDSITISELLDTMTWADGDWDGEFLTNTNATPTSLPPVPQLVPPEMPPPEPTQPSFTAPWGQPKIDSSPAPPVQIPDALPSIQQLQDWVTLCHPDSHTDAPAPVTAPTLAIDVNACIASLIPAESDFVDGVKSPRTVAATGSDPASEAAEVCMDMGLGDCMDLLGELGCRDPPYLNSPPSQALLQQVEQVDTDGGVIFPGEFPARQVGMKYKSRSGY